MAENYERSAGRSKAYKLDAGGAPAESGPFIGEIMAHVPDTRSAKVKVYIEIFSGPNKMDPTGWRDVSYISPFYGTTAPSSPPIGPGDFVQNKHSYGMWFTPPDLGTKIICFFANGDPNQGYYLGSVVTEDAHHMVPAIGASKNFVAPTGASAGYFSESTQLPVIEINDANEGISDTSRFFDSEKPLHQVQTFVLLQQGLLNDTVRGSIGSNSYRETPSTVFGVSTPGRAIYQGGYSSQDLTQRLNQDANNPGTIPLETMKVVGREGGHSIVLDDGDQSGDDQLVRIRTAKGHQILLSDSGNTLHIIHANGQSWMELGAEGTIDLYAANSVNIRAGQINMHADAGININAGASINARSGGIFNIESKSLQLTGESSILAYSDKFVGIKSDGSLSLESEKAGTWEAGSQMTLSAGCLDLNGAKAPSVPKTTKAPLQQLPDVKFENNVGWTVEENKIQSVATRVPTHEPWPLHQFGTNTPVNLDADPEQVPLEPALEAKLDQVQDTEFNAIEVTDYETQEPVDVKVGTIEPSQVTAMLAQASAEVPQNFNEISSEFGVGKYGFDAPQLEKAGYLKSGTSDLFKTELGTNFAGIMQSPSVWTGKDDVGSLDSFLGDNRIQDLTQRGRYNKGLDSLRSSGLVTGLEPPDKLAGFVQASAKYDATTIKDWAENKPIGANIVTDINKSVRGGQYSVELATQKTSAAIQGYSTKSVGSTNTVTRTNLDASAETVIRTEKTTGPSYTRTSEIATRRQANSAERVALEQQVNDITNVEIPAAKARYLSANPDKKFADFLKSSEYKALVARRTALQQQIESL